MSIKPAGDNTRSA